MRRPRTARLGRQLVTEPRESAPVFSAHVRSPDRATPGKEEGTGWLSGASAILALIIAGAFMLRVWDVGGRAMHLDEATVAWFAWQLLTGHGYAYDPVYHGPFQHEMLALLFLLFEPSQTSARLLAVVLGTGLVVLPWFLRDYLGRPVAMISCGLLAISPSFVYFARFERDDTYMEFFTLLMVVFALRLVRDRKPWQLYGLVAATALAFTTKESIYILFFIFGTYLAFLAAGMGLGRLSRNPTTAMRREETRSVPLEDRFVTSGVPRNRLRLPNWVSARWLVPRIAEDSSNGRMTIPVLMAMGAGFVAALTVTPFTGVYLPVPLATCAAVGLAVTAASASSSRRVFRSEQTNGEDQRASSEQAIGNSQQPIGNSQQLTANSQQPKANRQQPTPAVWRSHWVNSITIGVAIVILMYSTFGTNLNGLWDRGHPFFNNDHSCPYSLALNLDACRKDIAGGLFYWLSQHKVARGGQPWYYYLLIFGLYEQIAAVLALFALVRTFVSRSIPRGSRSMRVFLGYWAVLALVIYSWAGEKFPWLGIHPLLPIVILAAVGLHDVYSLAAGRLGSNQRRSRPASALGRAALVGVAVLLLFELHNTYVLNFVDGANPVEMMVYVQSSPDTVADANRIDQLSNRATGGTTLPVTIDTTDAWPFAWYLRNMPDAGYPSDSAAVKPPYSQNPVIILDQTDADTLNAPASLQSGYTRTLRRLDWWFPEDYKTWTWSSFARAAINPASWRAIWNWEVARTPFGPRDGTWYYLYIKKGYFSPF
jgi:predicted membrane-bound mannosyltransferase